MKLVQETGDGDEGEGETESDDAGEDEGDADEIGETDADELSDEDGTSDGDDSADGEESDSDESGVEESDSGGSDVESPDTEEPDVDAGSDVAGDVYKRIFISGCRPRLPLNSFADEHVLVERLGDGVCEGPEVLRVPRVVRDQGIERVVVAAFVLAPEPDGVPAREVRAVALDPDFLDRLPALQRVRSACRGT